MTPDDLKAVGDALYGPMTPWHSIMASDLEITRRSLLRWLNGERPIPDFLVTDLAELCRTRAVQLDDAAFRLDGVRRRA